MTPVEMAAIHAAAMRTGRAWPQTEIAALLSAPGAFNVAVPDGFAIGRVTLDEAELLTIALRPAAQGKGQGRACLARFHDAARQAGARSVFLEVAETNAPARALYGGAGYATVGHRRDYYGPDNAALVLRLNLVP